MKRTNNLFQGYLFPYALILILLLMAAMWSSYNLLQEDEGAPLPRISVIVEDSSNERWTAFRLGVDQAAREYGADVTFTPSSVFGSAEDQMTLISQEVAGGTDTFILSPYDSEQTDFSLGTLRMVFVETDGIRDSSEGTAAVVPPGRQMGQALGEMLLKKGGPGISVAVLTGNLRQYSEMEMLRGLTETVEEAGGSIFIAGTESEDLSGILERAKSQDLIAVLDDSLLLQAAALSASEGWEEGKLYGIGCSPSNISYLDRGVISGMVIPNEFTMGYQSLAQLAGYLRNDIPVMKDIEIGFASVLSEEVHDPENEKLLFPLVQ